MAKTRPVSRFQRLRGTSRARAVGEVLSRWRAASSSKAAFCRAEGIASVTLSRWLSEFGADAGPQPAPTRFMDVVLSNRAVLSPSPFAVTLRDGVRLRVPAGFDSGDLARLLSALTSC